MKKCLLNICIIYESCETCIFTKTLNVFYSKIILRIYKNFPEIVVFILSIYNMTTKHFYKNKFKSVDENIRAGRN